MAHDDTTGGVRGAIDVHSHFLPPTFTRALRDGDLQDVVSPVLTASLTGEASEVVRSVDARLDAMDRAGVSISLLSLVPPGAQVPDGDLAARLAAESNDELLELADRHAPRFGVLLALPLPHAEACLAELERVGKNQRAVGVAIFSNADGWTIDDVSLTPVYEAVADLRLPMMVHPALDELPPAQRDWGLGACLAAPVSSSLGALRLILSGMLDRVPGLTPLVPHLGGVLPFLAQRIDDQAAGENSLPPSDYLRTRFLYDSCSYHGPALQATLETVGADRIMLGSDYPFRGALGRPVTDIETNAPAAVRDALLAGNAWRHFDRLALLESLSTDRTGG